MYFILNILFLSFILFNGNVNFVLFLEITGELATGLTPQAILDKIRDNKAQGGKQRMDYIEKRDL